MRPVRAIEVDVLRRLTSADFDGVEQLRAQVETIQQVESSCGCGCPSFTPTVDRRVAPPAPLTSLLPSELVELERQDGVPRTVIWFADTEGYVTNVECVYYDEAVDAWPAPQDCAVVTGSR